MEKQEYKTEEMEEDTEKDKNIEDKEKVMPPRRRLIKLRKPKLKKPKIKKIKIKKPRLGKSIFDVRRWRW